MNELYNLKKLPLTEHFDHEEQDFTPWLMDNLHLLEGDELLGFELEEVRREVQVGRYQADLVARGSYNEKTVVIENQFATTDHDHLGKSIVYGAGEEADVIVWLAEEFNAEHIDALQMLNRHTDTDLAFLGFEVGLRQIDDSPYAVDITPIVRPDGWPTTEAKEDLSETEKSQLQFWGQFREHLHDEGYPEYASRSHRPSASYSIYPPGINGAYIRPTANYQQGTLSAVIRIEAQKDGFGNIDRDEFEDRCRHHVAGDSYQRLQVDMIKSAVWERRPDGEFDKIVIEYGEADLYDENQWADYHQWLTEVTELFDEVLSETLE